MILKVRKLNNFKVFFCVILFTRNENDTEKFGTKATEWGGGGGQMIYTKCNAKKYCEISSCSGMGNISFYLKCRFVLFFFIFFLFHLWGQCRKSENIMILLCRSSYFYAWKSIRKILEPHKNQRANERKKRTKNWIQTVRKCLCRALCMWMQVKVPLLNFV